MLQVGSKLAHVSLQKSNVNIIWIWLLYCSVFTVTLALVSWEFSQLLRKDHQYNVHSFSYICYTQSRWNIVQIQPSSFLKVRCTFFSLEFLVSVFSSGLFGFSIYLLFCVNVNTSKYVLLLEKREIKKLLKKREFNFFKESISFP